MAEMVRSVNSNELVEKMIKALTKSAVSSGKMDKSEIWPIHPIKTFPYFGPFLKDCKSSLNKAKKILDIEEVSSKLRPSFFMAVDNKPNPFF